MYTTKNYKLLKTECNNVVGTMCERFEFQDKEILLTFFVVITSMPESANPWFSAWETGEDNMATY